MIVEDDVKIASILHGELQRYGLAATVASDYAHLKEEVLAVKPDLILLDVNLPCYDGYYWCRQVRTVSKVPIIFISARSGEVDQVRGLEAGGDDYIPKPFSLELVMAKVQSTLRRVYGEYAGDATSDVIQVGDLQLNRLTNCVSTCVGCREVSPKEFRLLWALAQRPGQIVSREELLEALWDEVDFVDDNTLTVNVSRVRRQLEEVGLAGVIETKRGQGYMLRLKGS
jgi:two-component system OmpR family response regulator